MSVIDPATGELNMARLQKEMAQHMLEDDRYHRVDEMKKKAITTSKNYDEFRQFVACAEDMLKPVKSAELAELRQGNTGWQKNRRDIQNNVLLSKKCKEKSTFGAENNIPKNPLEFERDWRRVEDRAAYLQRNGSKALGKLWHQELDATVLGEVLAVIVEFKQPIPWLFALSQSNRFSLNAAFIDNERTKQKALSIIDSSNSSVSEEDQNLLQKIAPMLRKVLK
mmetsp:Transcript_6777/g.9488  ORF Transcript_6777/g.9488 Transcript_6777/m.9488 type:complete len:224 (-) Transcript_6777:34-705(-)